MWELLSGLVPPLSGNSEAHVLDVMRTEAVPAPQRGADRGCIPSLAPLPYSSRARPQPGSTLPTTRLLTRLITW